MCRTNDVILLFFAISQLSAGQQSAEDVREAEDKVQVGMEQTADIFFFFFFFHERTSGDYLANQRRSMNQDLIP